MTQNNKFNKKINSSSTGNNIIIVDPFKQQVTNELKFYSKSANYRLCKFILQLHIMHIIIKLFMVHYINCNFMFH